MIRRPKVYAAAMAVVAAVGLAPVTFNLVIDAYDHNRMVDLDLDKREISVKAHYPLYKMIEYPRIKAETVVLGDSRARALQDVYWRELGRDDVYNFAYGGATVYEIYDTFRYLRDTADVETLIISLPLRSMDHRFKQGMNRVPEAIEIAENPFRYYTNWFVAKTGWRLLRHRYPDLFRFVDGVGFNVIGQAEAAEFGAIPHLELDALLDPDLCAACALTPPPPGFVLRNVFAHRGFGLGVWGRYYPQISVERDLPQLFAKQVGTNGAADWRRFKETEDLWRKVEEIASWAEQEDVNLVFLIPPTVSEMQRRIADFGLAAVNHRFRERLSTLAPVVDLDFDTPFTRDLSNFTDAYHFGSAPARRIVGELLQIFDRDADRVATARDRRTDLVCPLRPADVTHRHTVGTLELVEGTSCRIWQRVGPDGVRPDNAAARSDVTAHGEAG